MRRLCTDNTDKNPLFISTIPMEKRKVLISKDINIMGQEKWVRKEIKRHIPTGNDILYSGQYYFHYWWTGAKL